MSTTPPPSDPDRNPDDAWQQPANTGDSPETQPGDRSQGVPSMPPPPPLADEAPRQRPEPPSSILNAVRLMYVGAAVSALSALLGLTARDTIRDQLVESDPDLSPDQVDTAVNVTVAGLVVVGLISVGLWLWMAYANRRGRSWARVVATILGGLNILFALLSLAQAGGPGMLLNLVSVLLAAAILWLLYRRESTEYYNAVSAYRRA